MARPAALGSTELNQSPYDLLSRELLMALHTSPLASVFAHVHGKSCRSSLGRRGESSLRGLIQRAHFVPPCSELQTPSPISQVPLLLTRPR